MPLRIVEATVAVNDSRTTNKGASVTIPVLANDTDADGNALSVTALTQPANGTVVVAERMIRWFFLNAHDGRGAAIAIVLFVAVIPVMIWNVRRFREQELER